MRLPHRLQGQKVKSQGGAGAYCGGHLVRIEQLTNGSRLSRNLNFSLSHSHAVITFTETSEILTTEYRVRVQTSVQIATS